RKRAVDAEETNQGHRQLAGLVGVEPPVRGERREGSSRLYGRATQQLHLDTGSAGFDLNRSDGGIWTNERDLIPRLSFDDFGDHLQFEVISPRVDCNQPVLP